MKRTLRQRKGDSNLVPIEPGDGLAGVNVHDDRLPKAKFLSQKWPSSSDESSLFPEEKFGIQKPKYK
jgi:hypothetical protein